MIKAPYFFFILFVCVLVFVFLTTSNQGMWMNDPLLNQFSLLGSSGVYTAIIGVPLFLFLRRREKKK